MFCLSAFVGLVLPVLTKAQYMVEVQYCTTKICTQWGMYTICVSLLFIKGVLCFK